MHSNLANLPKIRVIIRKRPLNKKQLSRGQKDIIQIPNNHTVLVKQQKVKVDLTPYTDQYKFIFDGAYHQNVSNEQIYQSTIRPLIDAAYDGARVSCFAYGQTGSGKTYTMLGDGSSIKGLYLLAAKDVFDIKKNYQDISVWVSFYEIYCGKLYDLLNDRTILHARQDAKNNINIVGLSERRIQSIHQVMNTIQFGTSVRVTSQNSTNVDSSRSHAILQMNLKKNKKVHGKISFIDLAGSERAADHADQTDKQTRIDGAQINKSLLALKQCIRALDQNKNHTPFRGSKLTMVLKDSFTGYCKTVMIGNISPNSLSCENTLNTLKYADRVKQLKKQTKGQSLKNDYLNDLSRELMLPRQLVNHHQLSKNQAPQHSQSQQILQKRNIFDQQLLIDDYEEQKPRIHRISKKNSNNDKNLFNNIIYQKGSNTNKQFAFNNNLNNNNNYHSSSPITPMNKINNSNKNLINRHRSSSSNNNINNQFDNSRNCNNPNNRNSPHQTKQQIYQRLNQRHEQMLQKLIQGEQNLLEQHQQYINYSVDCAKQHIHRMNQADKVGSSIHNYVNELDNSLEGQIQKIYKLKALIENLKYNLDESKKIQNLYIEINQDQSLLDNQSKHNLKNERNKFGHEFQQKNSQKFYNQHLDIQIDGNEQLLFE